MILIEINTIGISKDLSLMKNPCVEKTNYWTTNNFCTVSRRKPWNHLNEEIWSSSQEPKFAIRQVLQLQSFSTKEDHNILQATAEERNFCLPSLIFNKKKRGSFTCVRSFCVQQKKGISLPFAYSDFPPSVVQKISGSLPYII